MGGGRVCLVFLLASCGAVLVAALLSWYWRQSRRKNISDLSLLKPYSLSNHRVDVVESCERCEKLLRSKSEKSLALVGLDCEWVGGISDGGEGNRCVPVALSQLAFYDNHCVLVRLCKTGELPASLSDLLQNPRILKFGVGIDTDAKRLMEAYGVTVNGCVDLRYLAVACGIRGGRGLQGLAASLLSVELNKSWRLRCSDWEADHLSSQQVEYAAADAAVALDIVTALVSIKLQQETVGSGRFEAMCSQSLLREEEHCVLVSLCGPVVDVPYKQPKTNRSTSQQQTLQPKRRMSARCARQRPLYDNCRLLSPDGSLLSTVNNKKIKWYLQRQLGTLVCEDPPTVQLNFEPAGKPTKDSQYYVEEKKNVCVVCGSDSECIRKNIVPHEYRRYFPSEFKDHISHDILLLCMPCHQLASAHSDRLKTILAREYDAPLASPSNSRFKQDFSLMRIKNFARALLKEDSIPEKRRQELRSVISEYFNCTPEQLTENMIQEVAEIDTRLENREFTSHAELVVNKVKEGEGGRGGGREGLLQFQKRWRQHFLDTMQPRFLPSLWSVYHNPHQL